MDDSVETAEPGSEDAILARAKRDRRLARAHSAEWRKTAREDYDFVAGEQWSEEDKQLLSEGLRPVITFNRLGTIIDAVSGSEVSNRQEVQYIPREQGDAGVNEILTNAAKWVRDNCDAEDEESDAFLDVVICGMGWTETRMDYDEDVEGQVRIDRVDPLEMTWDHRASKRNLSDAKWVGREIKIPADEFEAEWPDKVDECRASTGDEFSDADDETGGEPTVNDPRGRYSEDSDSKGSQDSAKHYRVFEYQWIERQAVHVVMDPTSGELKEYTADEFKTISERAKKLKQEFKSVKQRRKVYMRAFICGNTLLESGPSPCKYSFTYKAITGKRDRNANTWYGIVRAMKDPQRWANKFFSQILHIINTNAKGGVMVETGAVSNVRKFEDGWAKPDGIAWLNSGALAKGSIQPKPPAPYPQGVDRMMEFAVGSIRDVSGVNLELLGMADREQAGVLEYQRKQAGLTILATMFDSLRRYRKEQGRLLLHFIQEYVSDGRLIRITGQNGNPQYVPLVRQSDTVKYDVVVDDAPNSPNQKEKTWAIISQMMPMISKLPVPPQMWSEILAYSPLPDSFVQKARNIISTPVEQPPDPAVMAEAQKLQLEKERVMLDAQNMQQKMQLEREKATADAMLKKMGIESDIALSQKKLNAEIELKRAELTADLQIERAKAEHQAVLARDKAATDADLKRQSMAQEKKPEPKPRDQGTDHTAAALTAAIAGLGETMKSINRPRRIVRGKDGR